MWIFNALGFFSVVSHRRDPELVVVRGRCRDDLQRLSDRMGGLEVVEDAAADYRWRAILPRSSWAGLLAEVGEEIDYLNFKDEVEIRFGPAREGLYAQVWRMMQGLDEAADHDRRVPPLSPAGKRDRRCISPRPAVRSGR